MKYKINVSVKGYLYLYLPLITSLLAIFFVTNEYWNIQAALVGIFLYSILVIVYVNLSHIDCDVQFIKIKLFGITFDTIKINDIKYFVLTNDGLSMTALSKKKIKVYLINSMEKKYLFSLKDLEGFIRFLNSKKISLKDDLDYVSENNNNKNNYIFKIGTLIFIFVLVADIVSIILWDRLYNIFGILLVYSIILINIIISIFIKNINMY